jgi:outer membrane protein assembly factor BamB
MPIPLELSRNLESNMPIRNTPIYLAVLVLFGLTALPAKFLGRMAASDWPVSRGNAASLGVSMDTMPAQPELLWEFKTRDEKAGFEGTPVIADGKVFVGDFEGNVRAIDLKTGEEVWKVKTKDGFVTAAAVNQGRVIIGDFSGQVFCFNAKDGEKLWSIEIPQQLASGANFYGDDILLTSESGSMITLNASNGQTKWDYATGDQLRSSASIWKDHCLLGGCDGRLHKIDLIKGEAVGAGLPLDAPTLSTPSVIGNIAIIATQPGVVMAIDVEHDKVLWSFADQELADDIRSSPASLGKMEGDKLSGIAVVTTRKRRVVGLDLANGNVLWNAVLKKRADNSPVICDGRAWVGALDGQVYAVDLKDGNVTWSYQLSGQILASPAIADNKLVIATEKGSIVCFGKK